MSRAWKIFATAGGVLAALPSADTASARVAVGQTGIVPRAVLGAVHADVSTIDAKGQTRKYTWDKGRVTAKSDTSITIARSDGKNVTLGLGGDTRVRAKNGRLNVGDLVVAYSREGRVYLVLAFQTREGPPPANKPASTAKSSRQTRVLQENVVNVSGLYVHVDWGLIMLDGKSFALSYDRGVVTARAAGSITLRRADGKSVTLAVGEKTHFGKDGVEIGDRAVAYSRDGTALNVFSGEKTRR